MKTLVATCLVLCLSATTSANAASLITGYSGCIMKANGVAGKTTITNNGPITEPSTGAYFDLTNLYKNRTYRDYGKDTYWVVYNEEDTWAGAEIFWMGVRIAVPGSYWGENMPETVTIGEYTYTRHEDPNLINQGGVGGREFQMYNGDWYFPISRTSNTGGGQTIETNFETCQSTSTEANGNWISQNFATASEINQQFNNFEETVNSIIVNKKITIDLITDIKNVDRSIIEVKANSNASRYLYQKLINRNKIEATNVMSDDATKIKSKIGSY